MNGTVRRQTPRQQGATTRHPGLRRNHWNRGSITLATPKSRTEGPASVRKGRHKLWPALEGRALRHRHSKGLQNHKHYLIYMGKTVKIIHSGKYWDLARFALSFRDTTHGIVCSPPRFHYRWKVKRTSAWLFHDYNISTTRKHLTHIFIVWSGIFTYWAPGLIIQAGRGKDLQ
jgi:hypothetical protein